MPVLGGSSSIGCLGDSLMIGVLAFVRVVRGRVVGEGIRGVVTLPLVKNPAYSPRLRDSD